MNSEACWLAEWYAYLWGCLSHSTYTRAKPRRESVSSVTKNHEMLIVNIIRPYQIMNYSGGVNSTPGTPDACMVHTASGNRNAFMAYGLWVARKGAYLA